MAENADQPITGLPKKTVTGITANDYILGIDSAEGYQMLIQDLGNYIIQNATSSLMGSNQTIAAALNALNSNLYNANLGTVINNNDDLDTYTKPGTYYCNSASKAETLAHCPVNNSGFKLLVIRTGYENANLIQIIEAPIGFNDGGSTCRRMGNPSAWGNWVKSPTRYDIDTLNNRLTYQTFGPFACTTTTSYASTGQSFTMTKAGIVRIDMPYGSGRPTAIGIKMSESASSSSVLLNAIDPDKISDTSGISVSGVVAAGTYYIWARTATNGSSNIQVAYYALSA